MPNLDVYRTHAHVVIFLIVTLALAGQAAAQAWAGGFVGGQADHFLDQTGALTLADVRSSASERFVSSNGRPANHGIARERGAALWLRLTTPILEGPPERSWTFWLDEPRVRSVQVYLVSNDGATVTDEWRFDRPSEPGGVSTRIPVFAYPASQISGKVVYLRVSSLSSLRATLWLTPSDRFEAQTTRESLLFGALAGALIAVAVYSLSLGAAVGEDALVALSFFILSFAVFVLSDRGFVETAIVPGATTLSRALSFGATFWIYLCAIIFSANYLKSPLRTSVGRISIAILAAVYIVATLFAVVDVITDQLRLRVYSSGLGLLAIGALIVMGLDALRVEPARAGRYFLCWLPAICGGLARVALDVFPTELAAHRFSVFGVYPGLAASLLAFAVVSSIETKRRLTTAQRELAVSEQRFHDYSLTASDDFWETDISGAVTRILHSARPVVALQTGDNFAEAINRAASRRARTARPHCAPL